MSAGLGLTFVPMTLIATTTSATSDAGLASGLFNSSQQIGGALGPGDPLDRGGEPDQRCALGRRRERHGRPAGVGAVDGFQVAFTVGAGLMLVGVLLPRSSSGAATSRRSRPARERRC